VARPKAAAAVVHQQGMSEKLARLRSKQPVRASYWVPLSESCAEELNDAEAALSMARFKNEGVELAEARVRKAQDTARADSVELVFEAAPRSLYEKLVRDHPPSEQEKQQAKDAGHDAPGYGEDFLFALATVCCTEDISETELRDLLDGWSFGELQHLFSVVIAVNTSRRALDLDALGK
jgi:hypothetical protein